MQNSIINAALASYASSMTRYVCTSSPVDLDIAKCAVRWINSELELFGKPAYRTLASGLLDSPYLLDKKVCQDFGIHQRWFVGETPLDFHSAEAIAEHVHTGDIVVLNHMDDHQSPKCGTTGTVRHIDGLGSIHVSWETGSTLAVILECDDVQFVNCVA